jgi:transposase
LRLNVQKKQKSCYSGKQKYHTLKAQVVINIETKEIICTDFDKGKKHDFELFKKSRTYICKDIHLIADKGYQGIKKLHKNSETPDKKPRGKELTKEQKQSNRTVAKERIVIEHTFRKLKIFRILSERYRNRRQRFGLRFNLIAGIYNYELKLKQSS